MDKVDAFVAYLESRGHRVMRSGTGYKTHCPFHEERTPSYYIDDRDGHGYCHGGCPLDIKYCRDVVEAIYRLEFPHDKTRANAFRRAKEVGLVATDAPRPYAVATLPPPSPAQIEAMSVAFGVYHEFLVRRVGLPARKWLREVRGLDGDYLDLALETVGYVPDGGQYHSEVTNALRAFFADDWLDLAITTGIITLRGGRQRLRNRLVFAQREHGKVVYYQTRILEREGPDDDREKFLNPGSIRKTLYTPLPREMARYPGTYAVEGPMDALAGAANGFFAAAILGSAIPKAHILNTLPHPIIVALDNDGGAGLVARQALIELCQANAIPYRILTFSGKDPAVCLETQGRELFIAAFAA